LYIETELLKTDLSVEEDEEMEEMSSCGSVGAMGYQLPLGMDPDTVNVGAVDTRSKRSGKKRNKKDKK
jgi:hypothetical protein